MADLNQLVEKALETLDYVLEHPPIDYDGPLRIMPTDNDLAEVRVKVSAAAAILEFAASMSRAPVPDRPGCQHEDRTNMTTMGSDVVTELCRQCGAELVNGIQVKG